MPTRIEACFPNLRDTGYLITSPADSTYNCVAFAAGDTSRKWDSPPIPDPGYYWPAGATRGPGIEDLRSAFEAIGYEVCVGDGIDPGFEKVVLYVDDEGYWTHAAHQEQDGRWKSKIGDVEDIIHASPHCFGGKEGYGNAVYFMRRKRR